MRFRSNMKSIDDFALELYKPTSSKDLCDWFGFKVTKYDSYWDYLPQEIVNIILKMRAQALFEEYIKMYKDIVGTLSFDDLLGELDARYGCLLYTSPSPRDKRQSRMPSSA